MGFTFNRTKIEFEVEGRSYTGNAYRINELLISNRKKFEELSKLSDADPDAENRIITELYGMLEEILGESELAQIMQGQTLNAYNLIDLYLYIAHENDAYIKKTVKKYEEIQKPISVQASAVSTPAVSAEAFVPLSHAPAREDIAAKIEAFANKHTAEKR